VELVQTLIVGLHNRIISGSIFKGFKHTALGVGVVNEESGDER
jgi:hypothetical protein